MSFLPRLDDEDPSLLLADLSAMPDEDSPSFRIEPLPPPRDRYGSSHPAASSASGLASGSGSGSGSRSLAGSRDAPAPIFGSGSGSGSASGSTQQFASAFPPEPSRTARPRFSLFARGAAPAGAARGPGLGLVADEEEEEEEFGEGAHGDEGDGEGDAGDETVIHRERYVVNGDGRENGDGHGDGNGDGDGDEEAEDEHADANGDDDKNTQAAATPETPAARDDRLRASLAELKKFNAVFDGFYGALQDARAHNERVAARVAETKALLDKYVAFQGQSLHTRDLILNTNWTGAKDDEAAILAAEHEAYLAAERAREAARREAERLEAERAAAEERERERARAAEAAAARGRGRGRGTGIVRPRGAAPASASGSGIRPPSTGIPTRTSRPTSATGSRPTSAAGRGRWGHVQSSGYGPSGRRT